MLASFWFYGLPTRLVRQSNLGQQWADIESTGEAPRDEPPKRPAGAMRKNTALPGWVARDGGSAGVGSTVCRDRVTLFNGDGGRCKGAAPGLAAKRLGRSPAATRLRRTFRAAARPGRTGDHPSFDSTRYPATLRVIRLDASYGFTISLLSRHILCSPSVAVLSHAKPTGSANLQRPAHLMRERFFEMMVSAALAAKLACALSARPAVDPTLAGQLRLRLSHP